MGQDGPRKRSEHGTERLRTRMIKANRNTPAAKLNNRVLDGLQKALDRNPEIDLTTLFGSKYPDQLRNLKKLSGNLRTAHKQQLPLGIASSTSRDIRSTIRRSDKASVVSELSRELQGLLAACASTANSDDNDDVPNDAPLSDDSIDSHDDSGSNDNGSDDGDCVGNAGLWEAVTRLINQSEVIYEGVSALSVVVLRVSETMVAKVAPAEYMMNEFRTLLYLEQHLPAFPAPKLHGTVRFGTTHVLFTTFVPGLDLEKAWPQLDDAQKRSLSGQLDALLTTLRRSLPHPPGTPLGGVGGPGGAPGGGCKDYRRGPRLSSEPIFTIEQFEDFIFSGVRCATPIYVDFLRGLKSSSTPAEIVFTHGDVRPANIMVDKDDNGIWKIVGIVDWDTSGFYPDYWECVKMTNNMVSCEKFDWYRYLPDSVSPRRYNIDWCIDRILDRSLENS
ncbi:hypothetical protein RB596_000206 [Gaeumannomyces avenae]